LGAKLTQEEKKQRSEDRKRKKYNKTHRLINNVDYKICSICVKWMPSTEEYYYKNSKNSIDGLYPYCKKCAVQKAYKWAEENPEAYTRAIRKRDAKVEEKIKKRKLSEKRRKEGKQKEWQRNNRDKTRVYNLYRSMNKKHEISETERRNCKEYFNWSCAYCGVTEEESLNIYGERLHMDHVDPNGANDLSNNIPACKSCNSKKYTSSLEEWYSNDNPFMNYFSEDRLNKIYNWLNSDYEVYINKLNKGDGRNV